VSSIPDVALVLVPIAALVLGFGIAYKMSRREAPPREDLLAGARADLEERLRAVRHSRFAPRPRRQLGKR
jgi:cytochrome c-type biogenesis protein CcmH/NrfF